MFTDRFLSVRCSLIQLTICTDVCKVSSFSSNLVFDTRSNAVEKSKKMAPLWLWLLITEEKPCTHSVSCVIVVSHDRGGGGEGKPGLATC